MGDNKIIQGLDLMDFIQELSRKNKRFQAILLQNTEELFAENSAKFIEYLERNPNLTQKQIVEKYKETKLELYTYQRKLSLDWSNGYTRSMLRLIFGTDFEGKLK